MNTTKVAAIVLIVAGIVGLVYGGFTYTRETHGATVGPFELTMKDRRTINIPIWAGVGMIVLGGAIFLVGRRKG